MDRSLTKQIHSTRSPQRLRLRISTASYEELVNFCTWILHVTNEHTIHDICAL